MNETVLKERIQVIAKEKGVPFNVIWKQLLLERFLARLGDIQPTTFREISLHFI